MDQDQRHQRNQRIAALERELAVLRDEPSPRPSGAGAARGSEAVLDRLLGDRMVLENLPDIVTVMDRTHRLLYLNHTIPGRTVAEMLGTSAIKYIPAQDQEVYQRAFDRAWSSGEPQALEVRTISDFCWQTRFVPVKVEGQVVFMLGTSIDITERKRAEEALRESESRLRHAISASGMGTWTWDRRTDAIVWDQTLCQIFGIRPQDSPAGFDAYLAVIHPDDRARVSEALGRYLQTGRYEDLEHRLVRPDGEIRHVLAKATTIVDEQGHTIGFRGGVFDVTRGKRMEAQLHQAQKMEAIGQLTAGIAHNFNNALSVIIHNAALCQEAAAIAVAAGTAIHADAQTIEQLADIEYAGVRAAEMVRQLMVFARPDTNARKAPLDPVKIARRTLEMCRRTMDRGIAIDLETDGDVPPIHANAGQLEQVLLNICLNARDALETAPSGSPRIVIRLERGDEHEVRIRISDNGPGMAEEVRSHVFEPFFTTKEVGRGTGLGLAMAYAIVADHRGRIECESRPGAGTSFEVVLPVADGEALSPATVAAGPARGGAETILLIDDDEPVRRALREILRRDGYSVLEANDGLTGVTTFEREHSCIDLIVLDRSMPGLPGEVVLERLHTVDPAVPVVLLSGHPGAVAERGRAAAVLTKPTDRDTLLRAIRQALDKR